MTRRRSRLDPAIHRVPLEKVTIFEITDAELEALERGSPESLFLNLGIATTSVAISFFIALLTTTITDVRTFCVFVIICAVSSIASTTFCLLWWQFRRTLRNVAQEIRSRMPPAGSQEDDTNSGESESTGPS